MSKLLREGHSPDPKAVNGKTPLFHAFCKGVGAIEGGQEDVVKLLLSQEGVDVNSMDESRSTPLLMAAWYGREAIATSLLNSQGVQTNVRNNSSQTPLIMALETGNSRIAQMLLERYEVGQLDIAAGEGSYLLDLAIAKGDDTIARLPLQKHNIQVENRADLHFTHTHHYGRTQLAKAVEAANHEIVNILLDRAGVKLNYHDLAFNDIRIKAAQALFEGLASTRYETKSIYLYVEDSCGRKALMFSAKIELEVILDLSLKPNGNWVSYGPEDVSYILLDAAWLGLNDAVAFLLRIENIDPNFADEMGRTALMLASESGKQAVVATLLEDLDVQTDGRDQYARIALMIAAENGHEGILAMLLNEDDVDVSVRDCDDRNALMLAAQSGYPRAVAMLLENFDVQTNCKDKDGRTALMLAAQSGYPCAVAMLLETPNIRTSCKDKDGRTALMLAAGLGHAGVVTLLLAKDSVVRDCKDLQGRTAMSLAALGEHTDVMSLLLEWDYRQPDSSGCQNQIALTRAAYMYCCYESRRCGGSTPQENDVCTDGKNLMSQALNVGQQEYTK